jgi:hypothetical protein
VDIQDLWGTRAVTTGLVVVFDRLINCSNAEYAISVRPQWSKTPQKAGHWSGYLQEDEEEVVCDLLCAAWKGYSSTDAGYQVPRRCNNVMEDYRSYEHGAS